MTVKKGEGEPSSQMKGVWDSVVSWMKMAVDFIALDSTTELLPAWKGKQGWWHKTLNWNMFLANNSMDVNLEHQTLENFNELLGRA